MKKSFLKKTLCLVLTVVMLLGMTVPALAAPASNTADRTSLETMVRGYVEANYDQDSVVDSVEDYIAGLVTDAVMNIIENTDTLLGYASPILSNLINGMINTALGGYGIPIDDVDVSDILDSILNSDVIDTILSLQIVNDIIERTAEYAVKEALALTLGIGKEVAEADIETLVQKYTDEIFGMSFVPVAVTRSMTSMPGTNLLSFIATSGKRFDTVNPFYTINAYKAGSFNLSLDYNVTGWQNEVNAPIDDIPFIGQYLGQYTTMETYIAARIAFDKLIVTGETAVNFDLAEFQAQLPDIIWKAAQRAAKDVIEETIARLIKELEATVKAEIVKAVNPWIAKTFGLEDYLNTDMSFEEMGEALIKAPKLWLANQVNGFLGSEVINADMSIKEMVDAIEAALKDLAENKLQELIGKLEDLKKQGISWVNGHIQDLIEKLTGIISEAKAELVAAINDCFGDGFVNVDMTFEQIADKVIEALTDMAKDAKENFDECLDKLCKKLNTLKDRYGSICKFLEKLIERCKKCKDKEEEPPVEIFGFITLSKTVIDEEVEYGIGDWMLNKGYALDILDDITFEIYKSDITGTNNGKVEDVTGRIETLYSQIVFYNDNTDEMHEFTPGWYLVREVLGVDAAEYFKNVDDLLIYFNGKVATIYSGPVYSAGTTFTITQYKDDSRPLQALYRDENGKINYLRNAPALDVPNRPNNGGGALGTSRFTANQDNGDVFNSFCADIGAVGVKGKYVVDTSNHGLDDAEILNLVAALDYIYAMDESFFDTAYDRIALAQLVAWNMVLTYSDDPMIAEMWLKNIAEGLLYSTAWGELFQIEGYNNSNGKNNWYTSEYKTLIDDIIADPGKYVGLYEERVVGGANNFVGGVTFLIGDGNQPNYLQQRQIIIWFSDPVKFTNEPKEGGFYGELNLLKVISEDEESTGISVWLSVSKEFSDAERDALLDDISFEISYSSKDGDNKGKVNGVTGRIDNWSSQIIFTDDATNQPHDFEPGWYLVHEVMGSSAAAIFMDVNDLLIYFNGQDAVIDSDPEFSDDTTFVITQHKDDSRPLQALYRDENGKINYLRNAPALDVPNRPNNGGGALATSRFTAKQDNGTEFTSFCADIGAVGVKGKYVVDASNHGLNDDEVFMLMAALDHIYAMEESFFNTAYDRIALAQLVVWNMILTYSDDPMIADLWLRNIAEGLLYSTAWGELFQIEGYNNSNGKNNWYTSEYKTLINDIIADPGKYVELYEGRVADEAAKIIGGIAFLIGDGSQPNFQQQRQVIIWFKDPANFENVPKEDVDPDPDPEPSYTLTVYDMEDAIVYSGVIESGVPVDAFEAGGMYTFIISVTGNDLDIIANGFIFGDASEDFVTDDVTFTVIQDGVTITVIIALNT